MAAWLIQLLESVICDFTDTILLMFAPFVNAFIRGSVASLSSFRT